MLSGWQHLMSAFLSRHYMVEGDRVRKVAYVQKKAKSTFL